MNRLHPTLLLLLFFTLPITSHAAGFRCGNKLVNEGDNFATVLQTCGEADYTMAMPDRVVYHKVRQGQDSMAIAEPIKVDLWIYQGSPNTFSRNLYFENGILVKIELGDKGS